MVYSVAKNFQHYLDLRFNVAQLSCFNDKSAGQGTLYMSRGINIIWSRKENNLNLPTETKYILDDWCKVE